MSGRRWFSVLNKCAINSDSHVDNVCAELGKIVFPLKVPERQKKKVA